MCFENFHMELGQTEYVERPGLFMLLRCDEGVFEPQIYPSRVCLVRTVKQRRPSWIGCHYYYIPYMIWDTFDIFQTLSKLH